ncbi:MAG TPA: hypothetical protein VGR07_12450 [Thermoanaerobaculia bacterium]|jgi:hypothetical protein|nr:hypothetical protein [Thermoanaerobaculia bacterium]
MLTLLGHDFCCGRSQFEDQAPYSGEPTAKIFVAIRLSGLSTLFWAQLDTGSAWSILDPEIAEAAGISMDEGIDQVIDTRLGRFKGRLVTVPITLPADEGESLDLQGTFFIAPDWPPGKSFLGYFGLLSSIRFALDPEANHFYFGISEGRT